MNTKPPWHMPWPFAIAGKNVHGEARLAGADLDDPHAKPARGLVVRPHEVGAGFGDALRLAVGRDHATCGRAATRLGADAARAGPQTTVGQSSEAKRGPSFSRPLNKARNATKASSVTLASEKIWPGSSASESTTAAKATDPSVCKPECTAGGSSRSSGIGDDAHGGEGHAEFARQRARLERFHIDRAGAGARLHVPLLVRAAHRIGHADDVADLRLRQPLRQPRRPVAVGLDALLAGGDAGRDDPIPRPHVRQQAARDAETDDGRGAREHRMPNRRRAQTHVAAACENPNPRRRCDLRFRSHPRYDNQRSPLENGAN